MFSSLLTKAGAVIAGVGITVAGWFGLTPKSTFQEELSKVRQQIVQVQQELASEPQLGAVNAVQAQKFNLAGSGITANATSIVLQSFKLPDASTTISMSDLGTIAYGTLEPGTAKEEQISFTGVTQNGNGTATLTGVTRGLSFLASSCAETTANKKSHAGGTIFVLSNTACFYSNFAVTSNTSTITGVWTYGTSSIPRLNASYNYGAGDELKLVTYGQLASTSFSGTVDASLTQKGVVEIATSAELGNGTSAGSTSAPLVPVSTSFSSSTSATTTVPVTQANGTLRSGFIDQTGGYTWTGAHTFSATSTFTSSTVFSVPPTINTLPTNASSAANKAYVDSAVMLFISSSTPNSTTTTSLTTQDITTVSSTFTLSSAKRVFVTLAGTSLNNTAGDGCNYYLSVDGVTSASPVAGHVSSANSARHSISFTWLTESLSAASHTIKLRGNAVTGGTCTVEPAQFSILGF